MAVWASELIKNKGIIKEDSENTKQTYCFNSIIGNIILIINDF